MVEAAVRLVGAVQDTALIVDDVQWADPSSVHLLAALAERATAATLLVAYRSDEWDPDSAVAAFVRRLAPEVTVQLGGLTAPAIGELVPDTGLATTLMAVTDRSPDGHRRSAAGLSREGLAAPDSSGRWRLTVDSGITRAAELGRLGQRNAIARHAARFAGATGRILALLSLLGRQTLARLLAVAVGAEEKVVTAGLSDLATAGLVRFGDGGWGTAHDMVAEVVAAEMAPSERGRLHGELARALESAGADQAEIARHWSRAGETDRAATAFGLAASAALEAFADVEAEHLADAGLALPIRASQAAVLHERRAGARRRRGDIAGARSDLQAALGARRAGPDRAVLLAELAGLASGADDLLRASELAELAVIEAAGDAPVRAKALEVASVIDMNLDLPERSAERAGEALAIYRRCGDSRGAARILDARAMATFLAGDVRTGTDLLHRAANLFEDSGDLMRMITPRSTRGHGLVFQNRAADGLVDTTRALEMSDRLGHPEGRAYALWHRAEALAALGEASEAIDNGTAALQIARQIGHRGWTATAWRAIGIGRQAAGETDAALECFTRSLESSDHLDLFGSWAAARSAMVLTALGRLDEAASMVDRALHLGPALGHYEARLAQTELAVARARPEAGPLAAEALRLARAGGVLVHVERLRRILVVTGNPPTAAGPP